MILITGFSLLFFCNVVFSNSVNQMTSLDKTVTTGDRVVLLCTYETEYRNPDLYWYRRRPDHSFQFVLYRDNTRSQDADFTQGRFSVEHSRTKKTFHLVISSARAEDSATYYCALLRRISGYGWDDPLIFGKGTYLEVEPKSQPPSKPSVFLMKNETKVACLVKDFYPKNVIINLQSSKKITEFDPAIVVSASGKYSAVKLGQYEDPNSVTCSVQHNNEIVRSSDFELKTNSSGTPEPTKPEGTQQSSESCYEPKVQARKVNMMSLTLLGLRMLFAKSVAINFLLTAKLLFF